MAESFQQGRVICGKWGRAFFFKEDFPTYCNGKPGHDGPCTYENSRGNVYELSAIEAVVKPDG